MDTAIAKERMRKFGHVAEMMMPEIIVFSSGTPDNYSFGIVAGGEMTKEMVTGALLALGSIAKEKGWL